MIGRGLIANPGMLMPGGTDVKTLQAFYDTMLEAYMEAFGGVRNAMFRLKEHWRHLSPKFEGSEKLWKELRKTTDASVYRQITQRIFSECAFHPDC